MFVCECDIERYIIYIYRYLCVYRRYLYIFNSMSVHTAGDFGTNFKFELNRFFYDEFCIRTCIFIHIINIQGLLSVQRAFIINEYMINYYILRV